MPYRHIHRDERKSDERESIEPFCTLRPVAERQDVTHDEQTEIEVLQDDVDDVDAVAEIERLVFK